MPGQARVNVHNNMPRQEGRDMGKSLTPWMDGILANPAPIGSSC
jgi:hypothetical protein